MFRATRRRDAKFASNCHYRAWKAAKKLSFEGRKDVRSVHAVAVSISGDVMAGVLLLAEPRKKIAHPLNQEILAPRLIAQLQNHLPVIEIQGQTRRHAIGKLARLLRAGGNPGLIVEQGMAFLKNFQERGFLLLQVAFGDRSDVLGEVLDDCFAIFAFFEEFDHAKNRAAFGEDFQAAVRIFFESLSNGRGAADGGDALVGGENDAEFDFFAEAAADHHAITMLENMEREAATREEHDIQWKKWDTNSFHRIWPVQLVILNRTTPSETAEPASRRARASRRHFALREYPRTKVCALVRFRRRAKDAGRTENIRRHRPDCFRATSRNARWRLDRPRTWYIPGPGRNARRHRRAFPRRTAPGLRGDFSGWVASVN